MKYKIGDRVIFPEGSGPTLVYQVLGSIPSANGGIQYLVRSRDSNRYYISEENLKPASPRPRPKTPVTTVTRGVIVNTYV